MQTFGRLMSVALLGLLVQAAQAGDCGCAAASDAGCNACGCDDCSGGCGGKYCELKVGKKKIKVICYGCECDSVCLPDRSCKGCTHCENICADGACCGGCDCECGHKPLCKVRWTDWCPAPCGKVYDRKKLVKYEAEKEVPDYKWVVVDPCKAAADAPKAKGDDKPPTPPVPTPASTTTKAGRATQAMPVKATRGRMPTKAAPRSARVGEEFPLTAAEIQMVESQILQASHTAPAARAVAAPVTKPAVAQPVKVRPAAVQVAPAAVAPVRQAPAAPVAEAQASDVPWSLFTK